MEKKNKPFTIACEDFRQGLTDLVNSAGLPAAVVESMLQNCLNEVKTVAQQQYLIDKAEYEKSLKQDKQ